MPISKNNLAHTHTYKMCRIASVNFHSSLPVFGSTYCNTTEHQAGHDIGNWCDNVHFVRLSKVNFHLSICNKYACNRGFNMLCMLKELTLSMSIWKVLFSLIKFSYTLLNCYCTCFQTLKAEGCLPVSGTAPNIKGLQPLCLIFKVEWILFHPLLTVGAKS